MGRVDLRRLVVVLVLVAACGGTPSTTTTTTTTSPTTGGGAAAPSDCPPPPYRVGVLPAKVDDRALPARDLPVDRFTTIPGTSSVIWVDGDGRPAVALIRGALPPEQWPGPKGEVEIDGARGVAGPFEDGTWVVAWYEEPGDRCDLYMLVVYPPVEPSEVEATVNSLDRVAG
ncbi:MAG: hypothetical protein KatS3mg011_1609 [Acidimicrobiia bacterium]|nr:MAG: hypothetical protein KatS3mg011_1609 [Acidimicrobiia bacterium]